MWYNLLSYQIKISIHALREEGDHVSADRSGQPLPISIHALREEGDSAGARSSGRTPRISIHALREEGDEGERRRRSPSCYFYPRPPRGGRRCQWIN